jgi:hypothetical protein
MSTDVPYEPETRIEELIINGPRLGKETAPGWLDTLLGTNGRSYACTPELLFFMHNQVPNLVSNLQMICATVRKRLGAQVSKHKKLENRLGILEALAETQQCIVGVQRSLGVYGRNDLINPKTQFMGMSRLRLSYRERAIVDAWHYWIQNMAREALELDCLWDSMDKQQRRHPAPHEHELEESRKRRAPSPPEEEQDPSSV